MAVDIYTLAPIVHDSEEHIIPNSLGGRLRARIIDRNTNNRFGSTIDAALDRAVMCIRNLVDGRTHRDPNAPAPTLRNVESPDGSRYTLRAGGRAECQTKIGIREIDGGIHVSGYVPDKATLVRNVRKYAKRRGLNADKLVAQLGGISDGVIGKAPTVQLEIGLWELEPYRAILKIACNLLALYHPEELIGPGFESARQFVRDGNVSMAPVQITELDIRRSGLGPLDHLVVVEVRGGQATGVVVLYGVLAFVVFMGTTSSVDDRKYSYRVDQLGRRDRVDGDRDLTIPDFAVEASRSDEAYWEIARRQVERLLPDVMKIHEAIQEKEGTVGPAS